MKKRRLVDSSLELFLDTICNVFGGVLFIALLVAIQIQHTVGTIQSSSSASPKDIAEMRQELDQMTADIDAFRVLLETLQATMPKPKDSAEQTRADLFYKLSAAKGSAVSKEAELLQKFLAMEKERLDWENTIQSVVTALQQKENERQKLLQELAQRQESQQAASKSSKELQSEIDELNRQIAQKERNIKNSDTNRQRNETVYLPKLQDAGGRKPVYFVLRFNRFYKVSNRGDFDFTGNALGIPKRNRGIPVEDTEESKQQIQFLFQNNNNKTEFLSVIVYGDSADQWYIIRNLFAEASFKYELRPTADDTPWVFGDSSGSASVMD